MTENSLVRNLVVLVMSITHDNWYKLGGGKIFGMSIGEDRIWLSVIC